MQKKIFFILIFCVFFFLAPSSSRASNDTPTPNPTGTVTPTPGENNAQTVQNLQNQISDLQDKINGLQGQEKTLSSQIAVMDGQMKLTEYRIASTKEQITSLTDDINAASKRISLLQSSFDGLTKILLNRIIATYEVGTAQPVQILFSSNNADNFFKRLNYLQIAQSHDKRLVYDTVQAKNDYTSQKTILEVEKQKIQALQNQLVAYTKELDSEKSSKQTLLTQTQGSEANYQHLLAQARAQLSSFSRFVTSQGGASLLSGQTKCDSWGCYYNQRDSQWGGMLIDGQSGYSMAGYGCLITSIAMVASHMGHNDILPSDIAQSGGDNFAVGTAMLQYTITVKGASLSRIGTSLDAGLQSGPVIVGLYAYGGTHFVVIKSGSNGNYIMNDPYIENGHDISFTDHYSLGNIFEKDKLVM